jgi:hypothetical protein
LIEKKPFSSSNLTASDYWNEWKTGVNGNPSLESMESNGPDWRSDKRYRRDDGSYGTAIKVAWSKQLPLYKAIAHLIKVDNMETRDAIDHVQSILDSNKYHKSGKPDLGKCKPHLVAIYK